MKSDILTQVLTRFPESLSAADSVSIACRPYSKVASYRVALFQGFHSKFNNNGTRVEKRSNVSANPMGLSALLKEAIAFFARDQASLANCLLAEGFEASQK